MVSHGWALAYRAYSKAYVPLEDDARARGAGVWAAQEVTPPWEWRKADKAARVAAKAGGGAIAASAASAAGAASGGEGEVRERGGECAIKGNINKGDRVYHLPGSGTYGRVVIEPSKGERMFCSEEEAQRAGWRRAL